MTIEPTAERCAQVDEILAVAAEFNIFANVDIAGDRDLRLALVRMDRDATEARSLAATVGREWAGLPPTPKATPRLPLLVLEVGKREECPERVPKLPKRLCERPF